MKRKLLGMLFAVFAAAMMIPALAFADEVATTNYNYMLVLSEGKQYANEPTAENELNAENQVPGITWDDAANTWTFSGVSFTTSACTAIYIEDENVTLNIEGANTLACTNEQSEASSQGHWVKGDCVFTGAGTLTATGGPASSTSCGFYIQGTTTINGSTAELTINANASQVTGQGVAEGYCYSMGFWAQQGDFTMKRGTLKALGGEAALGGNVAGGSIGVCVNLNAHILGGTIEATGSKGDHSYGMATYGDFDIEDGSLNAIFHESSRGYGLGIEGNATFTGGAVEAGPFDSEALSGEKAYGILVAGSTLIEGTANVMVFAGKSSDSNGFYAEGDFEIAGGVLEAIGISASDGQARGIIVEGNMSIKGGEILAGSIVSAAEELNPEDFTTAFGIRANGNISVSGADAEVTCLTAGGVYDCGMSADSVTINEGAVRSYVTNNTAGSTNNALFGNNISITGGSVFACSDAIGDSFGMSTYDGKVSITGGDVILQGMTQAFKSYSEPSLFAAGMQVKASESFDGADAVTLSSWKGDGTDSVNAYLYLEFTQEAYKIIEGASQTIIQGNEGSFKSDAEFSVFKEVLVDGAVIDPANYEATEGSTIITLKADYANTLSVGEHTLAIVSNDGQASTTFTVEAKSDNTPPANDDTTTTGDPGQPGDEADQSTLAKTGDGAARLALMLGGVFLASLAGLILLRRKAAV